MTRMMTPRNQTNDLPHHSTATGILSLGRGHAAPSQRVQAPNINVMVAVKSLSRFLAKWMVATVAGTTLDR